MDIKSRLINYYKNNEFIQKYIKGLDSNTNEIVLAYNGLEKKITIDDLENIEDETKVISFLNNDTYLKEETKIDVIEPKIITNELDRETLNDIKILTEIKSKSGLDNLLKDFAINEETGLIDVNKAINIVEKNTIDEVVKSIKEHYDFDLDLEKYDKTGKHIGNVLSSDRTDDEKIISSFNNVKVYLEAANMYVDQVNFSEEDMNKRLTEYVEKVKSILNPVREVPRNKVESNPETEVIDNKSAGFADIFILTIIILVYAIIIVNLLLKLI
jgi:hypothetical protein